MGLERAAKLGRQSGSGPLAPDLVQLIIGFCNHVPMPRYLVRRGNEFVP
jgi:hypothetical protein